MSENPQDRIGSTAVHKDQIFTVVRTEPHTVTLLVWQSHCVECGALCEVKTRMNGKPNFRRRCPKHTRPRRERSK